MLSEFKNDKLYQEEKNRMKEKDEIERNSDGERESKVMRRCGIMPEKDDDAKNNNWELEIAKRSDYEWEDEESESELKSERKYRWEEKEKSGAREKVKVKPKTGKVNMMQLDELERRLSRKRLEWLWGPLPVPPYLYEYTVGNELACMPNCPLCNYLNNFRCVTNSLYHLSCPLQSAKHN